METWDRISESLRVISQKHGRVPPRGLLTASGNPWQRDAQRIRALQTYLSSMQIRIAMAMPEQIADELDAIALQATPVEQPEEEVIEPESILTEVKPRRKRRKSEKHEPGLFQW